MNEVIKSDMAGIGRACNVRKPEHESSLSCSVPDQDQSDKLGRSVRRYVIQAPLPLSEVGFGYEPGVEIMLFGHCVKLGLLVSLVWVRTCVVLCVIVLP